ncbi:MAG: hypothetical protein ACNA75_09970, partial [Thiohalomonadaceae bacterium]
MIVNVGEAYGANTLLNISAPLRLCGKICFLLGFITILTSCPIPRTMILAHFLGHGATFGLEFRADKTTMKDRICLASPP